MARGKVNQNGDKRGEAKGGGSKGGKQRKGTMAMFDSIDSGHPWGLKLTFLEVLKTFKRTG